MLRCSPIWKVGSPRILAMNVVERNTKLDADMLQIIAGRGMLGGIAQGHMSQGAEYLQDLQDQ